MIDLEKLKSKIVELEEENIELKKEIVRLKEGNFTSEEFQNLCHNLPKECGREIFTEGCKQYQLKLFGPTIQDIKNAKFCLTKDN